MAHRTTRRSKKTAWKLDEESWDRIKDIFPIKEVGPRGGRPPVAHRRVFEALIWFCRSGCPWDYLPKNFPSWSPCRRRLLEWEEQEILVALPQHLLALLDGQGTLRLEETFLAGSFLPAKKGEKMLEKPERERGRC